MKSLKIYWIIASVLLVAYIIAQFYRPKEINWAESLSSSEKAPYGTFILKERLKDIFPGAAVVAYRQPVYNVIAEDSVKNATYIIVAHGLQFSKADFEQLTRYVKEGNDVFVAAEYFGELFEEHFKLKTRYVFRVSGKTAPVKFTNKYLDSTKRYLLAKGIGSTYFDSFDSAKTTVVGEDENHNANFIKISAGKGYLYLSANPLFFSNYSLLKQQGSSYAATALSCLKNTKKILLDEYYTQGEAGNKTIMQLFFDNPALSWAYYITIFSLLIFVVFEVKRTQRVIPIIEPLENTTLEFVTVIGELYYEKRKNADIAHKKVIYLLAYLRDKYQLKNQQPDDEFIAVLQQKLEIKADFAEHFTGYLNYINENSTVTDTELIKLNKLTDEFYTLLH